MRTKIVRNSHKYYIQKFMKYLYGQSNEVRRGQFLTNEYKHWTYNFVSYQVLPRNNRKKTKFFLRKARS